MKDVSWTVAVSAMRVAIAGKQKGREQTRPVSIVSRRVGVKSNCERE
jgi:hypothetical protein